MTQHREGDRACEVAVVGAGAVGLTLALGLARAGIKTELVGPAGTTRPGRTVALLAGSVRLLEELGVWSSLVHLAAPLRTMRIVDATGSLFRSPPVQFDASELGLPAFGYNIVNDDLERELTQAVLRTPSVGVIASRATAFDTHDESATIEVDEGSRLQASLVIAADGRNSLARKTARIGVKSRAWPQVALTALFSHEAPHREISVEFHTRQGPFTLVPLPALAGADHRSSLVWVMAPDEARRRRAAPASFARAAEEQAGRLFGRMTLASEIGAFPITTAVSSRLTGQRLVLVGEAAHALPPIGAQGLNLSFRDVAALTETLQTAHRAGTDLGSSKLLDRYEQARRGDVALRALGVDLLNGSLLTRSLLSDLVRGSGLRALEAFGPLRRLVMRHGLVPQGATALESRAALARDQGAIA